MLKLLQQRFTSTSAVCRMAATPTQKPVESIIKNKPVDGESRKKINLLQRVLHVRRVARVNSGGKIRSISALVVVGDQNGSAGYGMGRGNGNSKGPIYQQQYRKQRRARKRICLTFLD